MIHPCDKCGKEAAHVMMVQINPAAGCWNTCAPVRKIALCDSCAKPIIELLEKK